MIRPKVNILTIIFISMQTEATPLSGGPYREISSESKSEYILSASKDCKVRFTDKKNEKQSDADYFAQYSIIKSWSCVNAGEALQYGYGTDDIKVIYNYKDKIWGMHNSSHKIKDQKSNIYNLKSKDSYGYLVTNNAPKPTFHFCMIHNYQALCGDGEISTKDPKDVTRLQNILKSFDFFE